MVTICDKNATHSLKKYNCAICDYSSCHKRDYMRHLSTLKHASMSNANEKIQQKSTTTQKMFTCKCGKLYTYNSCLSRHKLVCKQHANNNSYKCDKTTKCLLEIIKSNQELILQQNKQITDLTNTKPVQNIQNITNNNQNTTNQNNVTFNLNYFLNTTCKDALNINDFIASIQMTFSDLENTGKYGFVKNMTQLISRELGKLDVNMRPIHCSDVKRKVMHIREDNLWKKDTETCAGAKRMIGGFAHKTNVMQIPKWVIAHPRSQICEDKSNDLYLKIVVNSMDGDDHTYDKIITGVSDKLHVPAITC